ncbi:hypothetical protein ACSMX9_00905 [Streptomyces sp. LE64]|uniref:hypothetical protein n=1 Tax=Streptomyces sp. LE64 TaxID=3448653 RepID=UPI0040436351
MPISRDPDTTVPPPGDGPPALSTALRRGAVTVRDRAVVTALVEEEVLLGRADVRRALVVEDGPDGPRCDWEGLARQLYTLELSSSERVFLALLLSMVGAHQMSLSRVHELDEDRLMVVLRALIQLSGNSRIAVGTRV